MSHINVSTLGKLCVFSGGVLYVCNIVYSVEILGHRERRKEHLS